jgi:hypothetical protein
MRSGASGRLIAPTSDAGKATAATSDAGKAQPALPPASSDTAKPTAYKVQRKPEVFRTLANGYTEVCDDCGQPTKPNEKKLCTPCWKIETSAVRDDEPANEKCRDCGTPTKKWESNLCNECWNKAPKKGASTVTTGTTKGWKSCTHWRKPVTMPDGKEVYASARRDAGVGEAMSPVCDISVYLDDGWLGRIPGVMATPGCTVPVSPIDVGLKHDFIVFPWPDYSVPDMEDWLPVALWLMEQLDAGKRIEFGCYGGHGRTGTAIGTLMVLQGCQPGPVAKRLRDHYCASAIESESQMQFLVAMAELMELGEPTEEEAQTFKDELGETGWKTSTVTAGKVTGKATGNKKDHKDGKPSHKGGWNRKGQKPLKSAEESAKVIAEQLGDIQAEMRAAESGGGADIDNDYSLPEEVVHNIAPTELCVCGHNWEQHDWQGFNAEVWTWCSSCDHWGDCPVFEPMDADRAIASHIVDPSEWEGEDDCETDGEPPDCEGEACTTCLNEGECACDTCPRCAPADDGMGVPDYDSPSTRGAEGYGHGLNVANMTPDEDCIAARCDYKCAGGYCWVLATQGVDL